VSIVEPYLKTIRRLATSVQGVRFRRAGSGANSAGSKESSGEETASLLRELRGVADGHGIELRVCSNPEHDLPASRCASAELFRPWGRAGESVASLRLRPSRPGCRCLEVADIGMDNTCIGGCRYCYATVSDEVTTRPCPLFGRLPLVAQQKDTETLLDQWPP
jgi:hypothetical protein